MAAFRIDKAREERRHRKQLDVSGVDAAKQWLSDEIDGRPAEPPAEKTSDRFVAVVRTPWHDRLQRKTQTRCWREQAVARNAAPRGWDSQH